MRNANRLPPAPMSETGIRYTLATCSLGGVLVARSAKGIAAILMGDDEQALVDDLAKRTSPEKLRYAPDELSNELTCVLAVLEEPTRTLGVPLDLRGTPFQVRVWRALRTIPPGSTSSYANLAERIGMPTATRAVAMACGANPLAVVVPCHRVVRADGNLSGYRWGVERKRALLAREQALVPAVA